MKTARTEKINTIFAQNKKKPEVLAKSMIINRKVEITKESAEGFLVKFDLDPAYGPCKGITRKERYTLAKKLGLSPSKKVLELITDLDLQISYFDRWI